MLFVLGHLAAILIGLSLGLIGGGGSILTVPVLVYLIGLPPTVATGYSLFIVGITAMAGSVNYGYKKLLDYRTAFLFGLPSIAGVIIARRILLPRIPHIIFNIDNFTLTRDIFIMLIFALLMIAASYSMIKSGKEMDKEVPVKKIKNIYLLLFDGFAIGVLTGFVGVGGGFLIIPALVLLCRLPMKEAIGTSLFIICINALIGFAAEITFVPHIDWKFLFLFTLFAVSGIFAGNYISKFISGQKLKPVFGWFVLIMGVYVLVKEIFY